MCSETKKIAIPMKPIKTLLLTLTAAFLLCFTATQSHAQCQASFTFTVNGATVTFANTSTGVTMPTYYWSFGDNTNSWATNPVHSYNSPGTYGVCLMLWDSLNNCQGTFCDTIVVTQGCGLTATTSSTNASACNQCDGLSTVTAAGGTPPYTYSWSNGSTTNSASNLCPGGISVVVTDANGCQATATSAISCPPGNCQAGFSFTVNGSSVTFANTSTGSSQPLYIWTFGDNTTSMTINPSHSYNSAGVYQVCLTMYDSISNCQDTYCDTVTVTVGCNLSAAVSTTNASACNMCDGIAAITASGGTPPYTYSSGPNVTNLCPGNYTSTITDASGCQVTVAYAISCPPGNCQASFTYTINGGTVTFANTTTGVTLPTYYWTFGDNTSSYATNPSHSYPNIGWYTVCLTVWDSASWCQSTWCDSIYISTGCGMTTTISSVNASNCSTCDGIATLVVSGGTAPYTYLWSNGATTASVSNLCPNNVYTVNVTDAAGCMASASVYISCTQNTICSSAFIMVQDTANPLQWYATSTVTGMAPYSYFWDFGDGNFSTQPYPTHVYASSGSYQVCLTVITADSCTDTYCDSSTFLMQDNRSTTPGMQYLNVINPATGIAQTATQVSYLAPNPSSEFIDLVLDREVSGSVRITNLLGSVVYESRLEGRSTRIDVSTFNNGYYNISINTGKENINRKITVMH
ncbi:MAG: adhesin AidA-related protein [Bacteroidetes bacterium]|nr:MAG: adhesin AidA-related protein [Bacteroidota bacterium]